ncbi:peptidoglycan-binding protein [Azospirillum sp.]|uniref:peptidoglycan-binding protein n=1 Tax=Azospirillum sp. TaxID=34012 RepID=UPI0026296559|nr:peptidoglycan-binding protein [Azospirillum sp.]
MTDIAAVLLKVAPSIKPNYLQAFQQSGDLFAQFGITTPLRITHFLAQMMHETGGGRVLYESLYYTTPDRLLAIFGVGNHSAAIRPEEVDGLLKNEQALAERVYGLGNPPKAKELGNSRPGDGYLFRGSGLLQTTGGANFQRMGDKAGVDFYNHPDLIVAPEHALKPALHEWDEGNLNAAADANDIRAITRRINGGYNGLDDRQAWFDKIWPEINGGDAVPVPTTGGSTALGEDDGSTKWLQAALNAAGAKPPLTVDGVSGPATTAAIRAFQQSAGLSVDGVAGPKTRAALQSHVTAPPSA